jgi:hypothetical protein
MQVQTDQAALCMLCVCRGAGRERHMYTCFPNARHDFKCWNPEIHQ